MSLPGITTPSGTPVFLAAGHNFQERSVYESVEFGTGHSRTRPVRTGLQRIASVSWDLDEAQAAAVDNWLENTLQAASLEFAAQVASEDGPGMLWWRARWLTMPTWEMMHRGFKRLNGQLFLVGEGTEEGPDTFNMQVDFVEHLLAGAMSIATDASMAVSFSDGLVVVRSFRITFASSLVKRIAGEARITEDDETRLTEDGDTRETED
jgi:hypothetical protein